MQTRLCAIIRPARLPSLGSPSDTTYDKKISFYMQSIGKQYHTFDSPAQTLLAKTEKALYKPEA